MYPYMSDSFCIVPVIAPASLVTALLAMKKSPIGTVRFSMTRAASQSVQYVAYVDFTPDETVRIGMTVIVYVE